jgi:hypothetical protein
MVNFFYSYFGILVCTICSVIIIGVKKNIRRLKFINKNIKNVFYVIIFTIMAIGYIAVFMFYDSSTSLGRGMNGGGALIIALFPIIPVYLALQICDKILLLTKHLKKKKKGQRDGSRPLKKCRFL